MGREKSGASHVINLQVKFYFNGLKMNSTSHSAQFKYMIFHIFTCILHRVYYKFTKWPAPSWLCNSVDRALHRCRRGHGVRIPFGSQLSFQALFQNCLSFVYKCDCQSCLRGSLKIDNRPFYSCVFSYLAFECK